MMELKDYIVMILIFGFILTLIFLTVLNQRISILKYKVKNNQNNYNHVIDSMHLLVLKIDQNGNIIGFNRYFSSLFKYESYSSLLEMISCESKDSFHKLLDLIHKEKKINNFEMKLITKDQQKVHILWTSSNESQQVIDLVGIDISERVNLENELVNKNQMLEKNQKNIWDLAYIDPVTKLYNKVYFTEKCYEILQDESQKGALILVNLDNFDYMNNIFGQKNLEQIISEVAKHIVGMSQGQIVAKLKDDEFAILLSNHANIDFIEYINNLIEKNAYRVTYEGVTIHLSVSVGVSFFPSDGNTYEQLFKNASFALMNAKENGKNQYAVYDELIEKKLIKKMHIETVIREGIENNRFFLLYQPQYHIKSGFINGFEALLRLKDEFGNIIPPNDFIDIAEETKLIIPIGYWVIEEACLFLKRLNDINLNHLSLSINVSVIQFLQDDFVDNVISIVEKHQINPNNLELEITETSLMNFNQRNLNKMNELRAYGFKIALDDFGTGYSSLVYFKKTTNISVLKIDREFINDINLNNNFEIVDAMIYLGHKFNFTVVAEGVETVEQLNILSNLGCDIMQGYLGSKPISEELIFNEFPTLENIHQKIYK